MPPSSQSQPEHQTASEQTHCGNQDVEADAEGAPLQANSLKRRLSRRATRAKPAPISSLMAKALATPNLVSLAAGFVDAETLPNDEVQAALNDLMVELSREPPAEFATAGPPLQYNSTHGLPALREELLRRYVAAEPSARGIELDQVVLTAGSNQLLHLVAEATLDPGDIVLCSAPTYFVYLGQLEYLGARAIGVACDHHGMTADGLSQQLETLRSEGDLTRVKQLYVVSYCDNPVGRTVPDERREELMAVLGDHQLLDSITVIDDMAYRELHLADGHQVPRSLRHHDPTGGERTIVAGTFSKSFSPGVRVGWGILPKSMVDAVTTLKGHIDFGSPSLNQHLMQRVLQLGYFDQQAERLRSTYREKRDATLAALQASLSNLAASAEIRWTEPDGGLYVWLELPASVDAGPDGKLLDEAIRNGVLYVPGQYCFAPEGFPAKRNTIRLSFGVPTIEQIQHGIASLANALETQIRRS